MTISLPTQQIISLVAYLVTALFLVSPQTLQASLSPQWISPTKHGLDVIAPFTLPDGPYNAGHRGVDLSASANDPVLSPTDGTVVFSGFVVDRPLITIKTNDGLLLTLEPVLSDLISGDTTHTGMHIGSVGTGGHCSRMCIHAGVRQNGEYLNPLAWFRGRPILLPLTDE